MRTNSLKKVEIRWASFLSTLRNHPYLFFSFVLSFSLFLPLSFSLPLFLSLSLYLRGTQQILIKQPLWSLHRSKIGTATNFHPVITDLIKQKINSHRHFVLKLYIFMFSRENFVSEFLIQFSRIVTTLLWSAPYFALFLYSFLSSRFCCFFVFPTEYFHIERTKHIHYRYVLYIYMEDGLFKWKYANILCCLWT